MRIGELARRTGSTARALRHYEQGGLITSERAANGYREYADPAVVRVRNIRALVAAGLTLEDIRPLLGCLDGDVLSRRPSEGVLEILRERLAVLERRIAAQTETRDRLAATLAASERIRASERVPVPERVRGPRRVPVPERVPADG
ncbi:MerR family transcriptional regulator [Kitasatospora sp. NPDC089797]|uniref:MerR family transcriptional regulator n=1 Tax=Kitasatospora sp. NPDC089797 TaxID=3155298 RepID=UPI00343A53D2